MASYKIHTHDRDGYPMTVEVPDSILKAHRLEIAAEIQATMEKIRLEDWGRSTRSKPSWLRALAVARRIVAKGA